MELAVEQPVGARTEADLPKKTGQVRHTWLEADVDGYVEESSRAQRGELDPKLTKAAHLDALGALESVMRRASMGQVKVGPDSSFEATVMRIAPNILELRPKLGLGQRPPRLFRLYYAEPASVQGSLLPLALQTKPHGPDLGKEQDASALDARTRGRTWQLFRKD